MMIRTRPRRLRTTPLTRDLVAETHLPTSALMVPRFVVNGRGTRQPVASMPGVERVSVDVLVDEVRADLELGLKSTLLFGVVDQKDAVGAGASRAQGPVPRAIQALRKEFGDELHVVADVCLCAYTTHGHCGVVDEAGRVRNDATLPRLVDAAVTYAAAGADWVAPSDMMDHRVAAIRDGLDARGHRETGILSYGAKYASAYYGPFRDAADSAPATGDRRAYQMDPRNVREAVRECELDVGEGADAVIVKPALAYLDVIRAVRGHVNVPVAAYNVSGEYAMVKAAAAQGWIDEGAVVRENLHAMRRAGADVIITYHARDAVKNGWV